MAKDKVQKLPSIKRLPAYLRELKSLREEGRQVVSTTLLAQRLRLESIVVRKDLEITGVTGSPGVGYKVEDLIGGIEEFLGWNNTSDIFLVGAGALGTALLGYKGFSEYGLNIVAAFDADPNKVGTEIHGKPVLGMDAFANLAERMKIHMAILCVPCDAAQAVAELMVAAGIRAIWNFTGATLNVPEHVVRQRVNLAGDLAVLSVALAEKLKEEQRGS
ncbi:MAG: redox-sensing transcriptional repressor Rex [Victivallales bacterium]|nr:redox-sensing transcriptional repressor Rex [Victivallales bacterium]